MQEKGFSKEPFARTDFQKKALIVSIILALSAVSFYDHLVFHFDKVYPHALYVPIILSGYWYGRRTIWMATIVGFVLLIPNIFNPSLAMFTNDLLRMAVFIVAGWMAGIIGEHTIRTKKEMLRALEEEERVFASANGPVIVWDGDYVIKKVNHAVSRITGYDYEELMGKKITELFPDKLREEAIGYIRSASSQGEMKSFELPIIHNKGNIKHFLWNMTSLSSIEDGTDAWTIAQGQDITELKLTEQELTRERDIAQKYLDLAGVMMVAIGPDENVTLVNKKGSEILGLSEDEIIGKNWFDYFIPPADREAVRKVFGTLVAGEVEGAEYYENIVLRADGEERIIAWHNSIIKNKIGEFLVSLSSGEDITDRKRAEKQLKESEENFRVLMAESPEIIFIIRDGRIIYVNNVTIDRTGYTYEELCSPEYLAFLRFIAPEYRDKVKENFVRHMQAKKVKAFECQLLTKDGHVLDCIINTKAISINSEMAVIGIITDTSESKRAEQALREQEEKYRHLVDVSPDAIAVFSKSKLVFANKAAATMLGANSPEELIGLRPDEIVHPDYLAMARDRISRMTVNGEQLPLADEKFIKLDGSIIDVEVVSVPFVLNNEPAVQVIARDVTARKMAEIELEKANLSLLQAEKLSTIGMISCGIGHELNNPLMGIGGYLYEIMKRLSNPEGKNLAEKAIAETERCSKIIKELSLVSNPPSSASEDYDVCDVLAGIESRYHSLMIERRIIYRMSADDNVYMIRGNKAYMEIVMGNLIKNAVEAMGDTNDRKLEVLIRAEDQKLILSVADTGSGISENNLRKVCEPFFTTKSPKGGTGLGLAICSSLVRQMGGEMNIESDLGRGTKITVSIPIEARSEMKVRSGE